MTPVDDWDRMIAAFPPANRPLAAQMVGVIRRQNDLLEAAAGLIDEDDGEYGYEWHRAYRAENS